MNLLVDKYVIVLRGKWKDRRGFVMYKAEPHPLSPSKDRYAVRVFCPPRTILLQDDGFKIDPRALQSGTL